MYLYIVVRQKNKSNHALIEYFAIFSSLAPTFGGKDIDPAVAIPTVASRIAERRSNDIERGLSLGRSQVRV